MDAIKMSRIHRCRECEDFISKPAQFAGPNGFSAFCTYGDQKGELDDAFMEGPDGNCPAEYWTGLEPVDLEAQTRETRERRLNAQRQHIKPIIKERLEAHPPVQIDDMLEILTAVGTIDPEIAVEISDELERQIPPISPGRPGP